MADANYEVDLSGYFRYSEPMPTTDTFTKVLAEIKVMHERKSEGYGRPGNPFHNLTAAADFLGVDPWVAPISRIGDKMGRLSSVIQGAQLDDERLRDTLIDLATYAVIAVVLYDDLGCEC